MFTHTTTLFVANAISGIRIIAILLLLFLNFSISFASYIYKVILEGVIVFSLATAAVQS